MIVHVLQKREGKSDDNLFPLNNNERQAIYLSIKKQIAF